MSSTIHRKYKYFHSTVQTAEDRRQEFHFCRLPFEVTSSSTGPLWIPAFELNGLPCLNNILLYFTLHI